MSDSAEVKPDEVPAPGADEQSEEPTSEEPSSQGDGDAPPTAADLGSLMRNPQVLAALQNKLGTMIGGSSGYIQSLPKSVKRRIKGLKKLQFEATKIESEFYREVHKLECEYAAKYTPLFEKRGTIVTGGYEPNDEECDWPSDEEKEEELSDDVKNKVKLEEKKAEEEEKEEKETKGIESFWLTTFKNVDMLSEMIQDHDEPILSHLQDVKVKFSEDPMGFTLEFYFDTNDYFTNTVLTKQYTMRSDPDESDPFSFEGPEIIKCKGCKIDWKKGKNVTVKVVKKKQKHKGSGTTRTVTKTVQSDSFFNFFSPPTPPEDEEEEMDEDTEALLAADFEIGHFIRERIVPRAVLYFTGEALDDNDEYEEGEEEEGGEEGDYDEDGDPDYNPQPGNIRTGSRLFHRYCAALALGAVSVPSSAPCDTRMRPKSAVPTRINQPVSEDKRRPFSVQPQYVGFRREETVMREQSPDLDPRPQPAVMSWAEESMDPKNVARLSPIAASSSYDNDQDIKSTVDLEPTVSTPLQSKEDHGHENTGDDHSVQQGVGEDFGSDDDNNTEASFTSPVPEEHVKAKVAKPSAAGTTDTRGRKAVPKLSAKSDKMPEKTRRQEANSAKSTKSQNTSYPAVIYNTDYEVGMCLNPSRPASHTVVANRKSVAASRPRVLAGKGMTGKSQSAPTRRSQANMKSEMSSSATVYRRQLAPKLAVKPLSGTGSRTSVQAGAGRQMSGTEAGRMTGPIERGRPGTVNFRLDSDEFRQKFAPYYEAQSKQI